MVSEAYVPRRGDIVWISFSPHAGHEQAGRRPGLVVSPMAYNERSGLALFCPVTSRSKSYPFEVALPHDSVITGVVLADQMKSLDWQARQADFACRTTIEVVRAVLSRIDALLDWDIPSA